MEDPSFPNATYASKAEAWTNEAVSPPPPAFTVDGFGDVGGLATPAPTRVPDGLVYVSSPSQSRVTLLARDGSTLAYADGLGAGLIRPTVMAADGAGRVYVADVGAGAIVMLGPPGPAGTGMQRVGVVKHPALVRVQATNAGAMVTALETTPAGELLVAIAGRPGVLVLRAPAAAPSTLTERKTRREQREYEGFTNEVGLGEEDDVAALELGCIGGGNSGEGGVDGGRSGPRLESVTGMVLDVSGILHVSTGAGNIELYEIRRGDSALERVVGSDHVAPSSALSEADGDGTGGDGGAVAARHIGTIHVDGGVGPLAAPRLRHALSAKITHAASNVSANTDTGGDVLGVDAFGHAVDPAGESSGSSSSSGAFDVAIEWDAPVRNFTAAGIEVGGSCGGEVTRFRRLTRRDGSGQTYIATVQPKAFGGMVEVSLKAAAAVSAVDGGASGDDVFASAADGPLRVHRAPPQCAASHGCRYKLAEFEDELAAKRAEMEAAARRQEQLEVLAVSARADRQRDAAAAELARETAQLVQASETAAARERAKVDVSAQASIAEKKAATALAGAEQRAAAEAKYLAAKLSAEAHAAAADRVAAAEAAQARDAANQRALDAKLSAEVAAAGEKARAEADARVGEARATEDINLRRVAAEGAATGAAYVAAIRSVAERLAASATALLTNPSRAGAAVAVAGALALAYFLAKEGTALTRDLVDRALRTPALIKEQSKGGRGGNAAAADPFEDVVVGDALEKRLKSIARSTAGAKRWNAPFRHVLFHGLPGTGKTMAAERLARRCGLDYAIMSGGDVAPLGKKAVTQLHRVFDWAQKSRRGVLLFVDEADAFLRRREDDAMGEAMRSALNALLYRTGSQSTKFCLVLASNRPEDLDDAVLDRMDELVEFPLPAAAERARILAQHVETALNGKGPKTSRGRVDCTDVTPAVMNKAAALAVGFSGRELAKVAASVQAVVYGDLEDEYTEVKQTLTGQASHAPPRPRLTAATLMRVVEWKVREHQSKDRMKRAGAALHAPTSGGSGVRGGGGGPLLDSVHQLSATQPINGGGAVACTSDLTGGEAGREGAEAGDKGGGWRRTLNLNPKP
jgi:ATPase family AAA domain-containing protein 3A/B